ncbi:hypothetical protein chiPu_0027351, partial [Chiloscyllium punctatum]|nr:hypothetical protein [Chiloscyllium punctatum]
MDSALTPTSLSLGNGMDSSLTPTSLRLGNRMYPHGQ